MNRVRRGNPKRRFNVAMRMKRTLKLQCRFNKIWNNCRNVTNCAALYQALCACTVAPRLLAVVVGDRESALPHALVHMY